MNDLRFPATDIREHAPDQFTFQLPYREPMAADAILEFLGVRGVPGIEEIVDGTYRRTLRMPGGAAILALTAGPGHIVGSVQLTDHRDLESAIAIARRLLDLDADPLPIAEDLGRDPLLAPMVRRNPGLRVPGAADSVELAMRAVIGQQVSVAGASTLTGRLVARFGEPLARPAGALTHLWPRPEAMLAADPGSFNMPRARGETILRVCAAIAAGEVVLDGSVPREEALASLLALRGIGPWTVSYVAMRALGDRDAFLPTDLGVKNALTRLGLPNDPKSVTALAERWRPWRAYANFYLWASLSGNAADVPPE